MQIGPKTKYTLYMYIYKTTNLLNNKTYIGKTKHQYDPNYYGSGIHIKRAINKYGKENFKLEIIVYAKDKCKLDELERKYIKEYREKFGKNSLYNITDGGDGGDTFTGNPNQQLIREKLSKAAKNRKNRKPSHIQQHTQLAKSKISIGNLAARKRINDFNQLKKDY